MELRGLRRFVAISRAIPQQIGDAEFRHYIQGLRELVAGIDLSELPLTARRIPLQCGSAFSASQGALLALQIGSSELAGR
jgi:hypothetical protein